MGIMGSKKGGDNNMKFKIGDIVRKNGGSQKAIIFSRHPTKELFTIHFKGETWGELVWDNELVLVCKREDVKNYWKYF